jgi:hypothetical protein
MEVTATNLSAQWQEHRRLRLKTLCLPNSASLNRRSENVVVKAVVIPKLKLCDIQREVFRSDFVERADDTASGISAIARSEATKQSSLHQSGMVREHQTSDAQSRIGEPRDSGFDASHRPGMTKSAIYPSR